MDSETGQITIVPAADAALGRPDATRRWAIAMPDGRTRFAGVTRTEADPAVRSLGAMAPDRWDDALVQVELGVVLTDGAGPYLVGAGGELVLVLGPHPGAGESTGAPPGAGSGAGGPPGGAGPAGAEELWVAMGPGARPGTHRVGLARPAGAGGVWSWWARADVPDDARVAALEDLVAVPAPDGAAAWAGRWGGTSPARDGPADVGFRADGS